MVISWKGYYRISWFVGFSLLRIGVYDQTTLWSVGVCHFSIHWFILTILDKYERSSSPQPFWAFDVSYQFLADAAKIKKKIHPRILQTRSILRHTLNLVDSFAVYVRTAVAFVRLNFSLFQGQNGTVIRVYCKWIHPLLLMGCATNYTKLQRMY